MTAKLEVAQSDTNKKVSHLSAYMDFFGFITKQGLTAI